MNFEIMASSSQFKVRFHFNTNVTLKNRKNLKVFIENFFRKEKKKLDRLDYIFCSDKDLIEINKQFLKHDSYTDIITFELSDRYKPITSEVYISIDRVKANSIIFDEPLYRELHRVIFHGVLHLCGYKDKTKDQREKMREKEDSLLLSYIK
ncbi:MAG: rRNA maturation RNase YbeY [Chitinophagaceae bacterium]